MGAQCHCARIFARACVCVHEANRLEPIWDTHSNDSVVSGIRTFLSIIQTSCWSHLSNGFYYYCWQSLCCCCCCCCCLVSSKFFVSSGKKDSLNITLDGFEFIRLAVFFPASRSLARTFAFVYLLVGFPLPEQMRQDNILRWISWILNNVCSIEATRHATTKTVSAHVINCKDTHDKKKERKRKKTALELKQ